MIGKKNLCRGGYTRESILCADQISLSTFSRYNMQRVLLALFALVVGASAFAAPAAAAARSGAVRSSASPVMAEQASSRRALLASVAVLAVPAAANAMTVRLPPRASNAPGGLAF